MEDDMKFEFCSEAWVAVADAYLKREAEAANLQSIEYTFNEVFTDAPAHLNPDEDGRVGWYLRITNGTVEARCGILEDPDVSIRADYGMIPAPCPGRIRPTIRKVRPPQPKPSKK